MLLGNELILLALMYFQIFGTLSWFRATLGKAFLQWVALSGTGECDISSRRVLLSPEHLQFLRHLWQAAHWPSLSPPGTFHSSGLPLSCFVTPGGSELPVPRHRVRRRKRLWWGRALYLAWLCGALSCNFHWVWALRSLSTHAFNFYCRKKKKDSSR